MSIYTIAEPVPVYVVKHTDTHVKVGTNTMTVSEFTTRLEDLGFNGSCVPATLSQLNIGGCWVLSLPPQQTQFLETPGDFTQFVRKHKGFGN